MGETSILRDALKFAGFLLANQAGTAATGEIPTPLGVLSSDPENPPTLLKPTIDSEVPERRIAAGKVLLADLKGRFRTWALCYDEEVEPFRILLLEVGGKGMKDFCLVQRYLLPATGEFQLVGEVDLLTPETLDPTVARGLGACAWRQLVEEGVRMNAEFGEQWPRWRAAMRSTDESKLYTVGEYRFACPSGWVPGKSAAELSGWMFYRLIPWHDKGNEPTIICNLVARGGQPTVQELVEYLAKTYPEGEGEILESGVFELEPGLLAGRVLAAVEENKLFERTLVPTDKNGRFLMISAMSQHEFWPETVRARDAVLGSLDRPEWSGDKKGFGAAVRNFMRQLLGRQVN